MKLDSLIVSALSEILKGGDKHITGYKLAKKLGLETSIVYRRLNQFSKGK